MFKPAFIDVASSKLDSYLAKYADSPLRAFGHFSFWSVRELLGRRIVMKPISDDVCRIAFALNGGLGDKLLAVNYIQCFEESLDCRHEIDLYSDHDRHLDELRDFCSGGHFVDRIRPFRDADRRYDLVFDMVRFAFPIYCHRDKIKRLSAKLDVLCGALEDFHRRHHHYFQAMTPADYLGLAWTALNGRTRLQQADIDGHLNVTERLRLKIETPVKDVLARFSLEGVPFVTLQRGVGGSKKNRSTRLWPMDHYLRLVSLLKRRRPEIVIVRLGDAQTLPIPGVDRDLRGKTDFGELKVLLRESLCHIDGECGMVHLRHFLGGGKSVVLFGPTSEALYGYPENANLRSAVCPGGCEWISADYEKRCPRGFSVSECLTHITPEEVLQNIESVINERL